MELPELVDAALGADESVAARIPLGGDDALFVTSARSLVYRGEGLLSDESIDEYPHEAEGISVSEGRRKSKLVLDYGLDGERSLAVPAARLGDAIRFVLGGVLTARGVLDPDEAVADVYRFSELTLVVASHRVVKHIGTPVWDEDFEQFHYDDVTDLTVEEGSVATTIVLALGDRQERFKAPNERARAVRETLEDALLSHLDLESLATLRAQVQAEAEAQAATEAPAGAGGGGEATIESGRGGDTADAAGEAGSAGGELDSSAVGDVVDRIGGADGTARPDDAVGTQGAGSGSTAPRTATPGAAGQDQADADTNRGASDQRPDAERAGSPPRGRGEWPDPSLNAGSAESGDGGGEGSSFEGSGFEAAGPVDAGDLRAEVADLREAVEHQTAQLRRQQETLQALVEELRRRR